jgi:hypothetical protein
MFPAEQIISYPPSYFSFDCSSVNSISCQHIIAFVFCRVVLCRAVDESDPNVVRVWTSVTGLILCSNSRCAPAEP